MSRRRVLVGGGATLALGAMGCASRAFAKTPPAQSIEAPVFGDPKAPRRLVVWGSCTCAYTAQLYAILKPIVEDMPKVASLEWRHFPLHKPDPALHVASLGFKGDRFWGFVFRVLAFVLEKGGDFSGLATGKLAEFAAAEGGSEETFKQAYADPAKWTAVKDDLLAGHLLGVSMTPSLFYNGFFLTPGGLPLDKKALDSSLRAMLKA